MLRGLIEKQSDQTVDPGKFMHGLNEGLAAILERAGVTMFATAFYGLIDLESGEMLYASAGHPGPIIVDANGPRQIAVDRDEKGPGLGLIRNATYPSLTLPTEDLERVVLFTDGVLEAENQEGEPFFEKRLLQIIGDNRGMMLEELLDSILTAVLDFSADHHFDDDVCLLAAEFTKK